MVYHEREGMLTSKLVHTEEAGERFTQIVNIMLSQCVFGSEKKHYFLLSDFLSCIHVQYCQLYSIGKNINSSRPICSIWRKVNFFGRSGK